MAKQQTETDRYIALGGTILFHVLLFVLFILIIFKTPIPPFPDTGGNGIEVNFGTSDDGMGDIQPEDYVINSSNNTATAEEVSEAHLKISTPVRPSVKPILTQQTEEAPEVAKTDNTDDLNNSNTEQVKPEPRKANPAALYKGKNQSGGSTSSGEGKTNTPGDQGSKDGSRTATYHGPGGGTGNSPGTGGGPGGDGLGGPLYSLANRNARSIPVPKAAFQEEGKVVVEITVDKNGNVINAKPGVKGSTTSNPNLLEIARKAALSAKFNSSSDAPEEQKGTITYNFILK